MWYSLLISFWGLQLSKGTAINYQKCLLQARSSLLQSETFRNGQLLDCVTDILFCGFWSSSLIILKWNRHANLVIGFKREKLFFFCLIIFFSFLFWLIRVNLLNRSAFPLCLDRMFLFHIIGTSFIKSLNRIRTNSF